MESLPLRHTVWAGDQRGQFELTAFTGFDFNTENGTTTTRLEINFTSTAHWQSANIVLVQYR